MMQFTFKTVLGPVAVGALALSMFTDLTASAGESRPLMTLDMAKAMADACEAVQVRDNLPKLNIAIVDRGADLVLFRRQNDAFLGSIDIAIDKAKSSASIPFSTRLIAELAYGKDGAPGPLPGVAHANVVAFAGGLPIQDASGALVGAIGVSGATADQDEDCAQAGIDAIADQLK
jgi:uncharacterized protein GlcG (DUF336 family)